MLELGQPKSVLGCFEVTDHGVFYVDPAKAPQWICSRLEIVAETRSQRGDNWGKLLRFCDKDGVLHEWAMPMSMLAGSGAEYREELLQQGLEIAPGADARNKLSLYIQTCRPQVRVRSVSRIGWHEGSFILPDTTFSPSGKEQVRLQIGAEVPLCGGTSGSLAEWQTHLAIPAIGNSRLMFALAVAFSPPLMSLAGEEGGGFHFRGQSSIGKTTLLQVAGSVWGGGGIRGYLKTWRATSSGLEVIASLHCDSLLALDELNELDPKHAGEIAYMLANGSGKERASNLRSYRGSKGWRLLFLSTGEVSLIEHVHESGRELKTGQILRMVDLPADAGGGMGLFEDLHGIATGDAFSRQLRDATRRFYGTAIRSFLRQIVDHRDLVRQNILELQRAFVKRLVPTKASGETYRVASRFGLVAAAGEQAITLGILPWNQGDAMRAVENCFHAWLGEWLESDEEAKAVRLVREFLKEHGEAKFKPFVPGITGKIIDEIFGFHRKDALGEKEWLVLPAVFRKKLCRDLPLRIMTRVLLGQGILIPDKSGKSSYPVNLPGLGKKRVYRIKGDQLDKIPGVPVFGREGTEAIAGDRWGLESRDAEHELMCMKGSGVPVHSSDTTHTFENQRCTQG